VSEGRLLSTFENGEHKQKAINFAINICKVYVDSSNFRLAEFFYLFVRAFDALAPRGSNTAGNGATSSIVPPLTPCYHFYTQIEDNELCLQKKPIKSFWKEKYEEAILSVSNSCDG
jgi:hypothetical protein